MKPLIVLLGVFIICLTATFLLKGIPDYSLSGRIAMSAMLLFTSIAHFAFTKGMVLMMPGFIPFKKQLVYLTGLIEIAAAMGLLIPSAQHTTAWLLIPFFILMLPVNINGAIKYVDYQKGNNEGNGLIYLWFRVPVQVLFIAWIYLFAL